MRLILDGNSITTSKPSGASVAFCRVDIAVALYAKLQDSNFLWYVNETEDVARMKAIYNERRKQMVKRLQEIGCGITDEPNGAFYVFANAKHISKDSYRLAFDILEKSHVEVTPGIDFGNNGEGYLRFLYANSMENIIEGLNRIENYLASLNEVIR